jgi:hypothetical protein
MKIRTYLFAILGLFYSVSYCYAQSKLIYFWHFDNTLPADGSGGIKYGPNPLYADYSATNAKASVVFEPINTNSSDTGSIDNVNGGKLNERDGFGGCCGGSSIGIRLRNPSDNMQFLIELPTENYKNIVLKYATKSSSFKSGQHDQDFSYSIDGKNFITTGLPFTSITPDTVWNLVTIDMHSISTINDNYNFIFRLLFAGNTTGTKGNNRFDNITVEGDIINPNSIASHELSTGYSLFPNPAGDFINLKSGTVGIKSVSIYNSIGVLVSEFKMKEKSLLISTKNYNPGIYFINFREINRGNSSTVKFIKK